MNTLGLEVSDAGFEAALGRRPEGEGQPSAEFLVPPGAVPAVAFAGESGPVFGAAAEQQRFLSPRQICDGFWDELSLQPSNLRAGRRPIACSELAYHFLRHVLDGLPAEAREAGAVALALPSSFTDGGARAEERVGILLGICQDLGVKLSALVDASCAALLDPAALAPSRGTVLHVDLGLRAAGLTVLDVGERATRRAFTRVPGAGWLALAESARKALADRFLRQTSFDVSADRRTEQAFYLEALEAIETFASQQEATLGLVTGTRERSISVPRDGLVADLRPLADLIAKAAQEMLLRMGLGLQSVHVLFTHRARRLCGLGKAFRRHGAVALDTLPPGAAARGAAVLAMDFKPPEEIADVPELHACELPTANEDMAGALRSAFAFVRTERRREGRPTHVVCDGVCYPLNAAGVRVATGGAVQRGDFAVDVSPAAIGACDVVIEPGESGWRAVAVVGSERHEIPGGDVALAPGDMLEIHGLPGFARLLFVRMAG